MYAPGKIKEKQLMGWRGQCDRGGNDMSGHLSHHSRTLYYDTTQVTPVMYRYLPSL